MEDKAKLIICLKINKLNIENFKLEFTKMTLNNIDQLTFHYQNEEEFFASYKSVIYKELKRKKSFSELEFLPEDIELNTDNRDCIYISKGKKKIRALFQNIKIKNESISIEDLVKNRFIENQMLRMLYICDGEALRNDPEYESIFKGCKNMVFARIKANFIRDIDIEYIWNFLKNKNRFFPVLRFLLVDGDLNFLINNYIEKVPIKEFEEEEEIEKEMVRERKMDNY